MSSVVDVRIARVLRAMQGNLARPWTVSELAKLAGASRAAFARLFRTSTGSSPKRWLQRRRLELAAARLAQTDETLARIACHVGYASEFALSRAFKRHFGVAPAHYRRLQVGASIRCAA